MKWVESCLHGERYRYNSLWLEAGEEKGRQTKRAPHSTRPKRLEGQGICVCGGGATDTPSAPWGHPKTSAFRGQMKCGWLLQPNGRAPWPSEGWHSVSFPLKATLRLLRWWDVQQAGSSERMWLHEAPLACSRRRWWRWKRTSLQVPKRPYVLPDAVELSGEQEAWQMCFWGPGCRSCPHGSCPPCNAELCPTERGHSSS